MKDIQKLKKKRSELLSWLIDNTLHPDFEQKHRELSLIIYKLDEMRSAKPLERTRLDIEIEL